MRYKRTVLAGICVLLALAMPSTAGSQEDLDQRYLLLATKRTSTMQAELDAAAAAKYHLISTWWGGAEDEMIALLEKGDDLAPQQEYRLLAALREETLARELREAAAEGFRVTPAGVLRHMSLSDGSGEEVVLILERNLGDSEPHEYKFIDVGTPYLWDKEDEEYVGQFGALQAEIDRMPDDGYRIVAHLVQSIDLNRRKTCDIHHILIAEKLPSVDQRPGSGPAEGLAEGPEQPAMGGQKHYRLIVGRPGAKVQEKLLEAANAGYELHSGTLVDLPNPDHIALIMERAEGTLAPPRYLLIGSAECCLGSQHDLAAERGYVVHPRGVFGEPLVAIMERAPGEQPALDYAWVWHDRTGGFQEGLLEQSAAGFEFTAALAHHPLIREGDGWRMGNSTHVAWLVKEMDPYPSAETRWGVRTDVEWKTLRLSASAKDEQIEEGLNEAARGGYCLVNMAAFASTGAYDRELSATMEKRGNSQECEYAVLAAARTSALQKDIDEAAGKGFRMLRGGMFAKHGFMGVTQRGVVMVRTQGSTTAAYQYLMLTTQRESTLVEEMEAAALDGYELLARATYPERTMFLERPIRDPEQ